MDTALFYTFSTIAQTLAGAIALLGAFVLYRLQSLSAEIVEKSLVVLGFYKGAHKTILHDWHVNEHYNKVFEYAELPPLDKPDDPELFPLHKTRLGKLLQLQKSLLDSFKLSLWLTVGLITAAVIILSLTPFIGASTCCTLITFGIGILWFIGCLFSYVKLARTAVAT